MLVFAVLAWVLRLALMPTALHGDFFFVQYYPYLLSHGGVWDIYGHFGDHFLRLNGSIYYPPLVYYWVALGQWLVSAVNPHVGVLMENSGRIIYSGAVVPTERYFEGLTQPQAWNVLAVLKLPVLVTEVLLMAALARCASGAEERKRLLIVWSLHPIAIFSNYMMGQCRALQALLSVLLLMFLRRGRRMEAAFCLGCLCLSDNFPWLLILPALLCWADRMSDRLKLGVCVLLPVVAVLAPLTIHSNGLVLSSYGSPLIRGVATASITLHWDDVIAWSTKAGLVGGYVLILWMLLRRRLLPSASWDAETRFRAFVFTAVCVLLLLYATTRTSAHYFMWVLPYWIWMPTLAPSWPRRLAALAVFLLFLFNLDSRSLNLGFFEPVVPRAMDYPSLHEVMQRWMDWGIVIGSARTLFTLVCLYLTVWIVRKSLLPLLRPAPVARQTR